jgi:hypothetical protein
MRFAPSPYDPWLAKRRLAGRSQRRLFIQEHPDPSDPAAL